MSTANFLKNESDVEQKFIWGILTNESPNGLKIPHSQILTKPNLRSFEIQKRTNRKLYYPDYIITVRGFPVAVVEAKPPSDDLLEAASEARLYASELNAIYPPKINPVLYSVVTNGQKVELREVDSDKILLVFSNTNVLQLSPEFGEFCQLLSTNKLQQWGDDLHKITSPERLFRPSNALGGHTTRSELIEYNDFGRVLASNFQTIFDPGTYDERKLIAIRAYVASKRKERFFDEIDRIIRNSAPTTSAEATLIEDTVNPVEILSRMSKFPSLRNQTLLLVGSVGSGKSTFVDHLRECALPEDLAKSTAWVRINLNNAPVSPTEIYAWIRSKLIKGICDATPDVDTTSLDSQMKLYAFELRGFEQVDGILFERNSSEYKIRLADELRKFRNDDLLTIKALERFLCTTRSKLLIVVLDNCDKRDRDEQLLMFQVAKYIQEEIRCLVILPLREETYEHHKNEPPLDTALKDLVFRIEPPQFQEVLKKRLDLVLAEARREGTRSLTYHIGGSAVVIGIEKLERFLHSVIGSLFENKRFGRNIIVGLAGRNIRLAFEIFLDFCRSGYIDTAEIFERQATGQTDFSFDQNTVSRVLFRTHRRFYDGDASYVKNLFFSHPTSAGYVPLLRYWLLAKLRASSLTKSKSGIKGFHPQRKLVELFLAFGVNSDLVREEICYLAKAGCILAEHLRHEISDEDLISITPSGHVHLELAHNDLHYLAACSEDSWFSDSAAASSISDNMGQNPWWNAQSWRNTVQNAGTLCEQMSGEQDRSLVLAPFSEGTAEVIPSLDLHKLLYRIDQEWGRLTHRR